jgi:hypothetical protein
MIEINVRAVAVNGDNLSQRSRTALDRSAEPCWILAARKLLNLMVSVAIRPVY